MKYKLWKVPTTSIWILNFPSRSVWLEFESWWSARRYLWGYMDHSVKVYKL